MNRELISSVTLSLLIYGLVAWAPAAERSSPDQLTWGAKLFAATFTPKEGLGPLFNKRSCIACHSVPEPGGMGPGGLATVVRVGRIGKSGFDPLFGAGGPIARAHSVAEDGFPCKISSGIPVSANMTSIRNAPALYGDGLIDLIPEENIEAGVRPHPDGVHGRAHWVTSADGKRRIGRFGWKADTPTLREFVADAFRNELGITSSLAPDERARVGQPPGKRCAGENGRFEASIGMIEAVAAYITSLPVPAAVGSQRGSQRGAFLFRSTGCDFCHASAGFAIGDKRIYPYSDLLLHNLGPDLDDRVVQDDAKGVEWRTTPLWGLSRRPRFLHDGRARNLVEAILVHGGEATSAKERFRALPSEERIFLLEFLSEL